VIYFRQHQFDVAFMCFSRAAQQGFATAQFCLAVCYFNGHGTARDEAAALPWLRQAAAQGDLNAEFTLGMAYRLGRGVSPDAVLANQWLQLAAAHGHAEAIRRVYEQIVPLPQEQRAAVAQEKISPSPVAFPEPAVPEKNLEKRRHDLQRLVLGLFGKK
jgi:TPR repeat protein